MDVQILSMTLQFLLVVQVAGGLLLLLKFNMASDIPISLSAFDIFPFLMLLFQYNIVTSVVEIIYELI